MQPTGNDGLVVFCISLNLFLFVILLWLCIAIGSEIHWEKPHRGALQRDLEGTYAGRVYDLVLATRLCLRWGGVTCTVRFYVRPRVNSLSKKFSCWLWLWTVYGEGWVAGNSGASPGTKSIPGTGSMEMWMCGLRHEQLDSADSHMNLEEKHESQQNMQQPGVSGNQAQTSPPHRTGA